MIPLSAELRFDTASAIALGGRETQEDALASDFALGSGGGLAVLADGMGGHAAGEVAAKIVVTEVFGLLKRVGQVPGGDVPAALRGAAETANRAVAAHMAGHPATRGMGATLVALTFDRDRMHWISVGDSPLWLWREGRLARLNEDHSLAPQIDWMVATGQLDPEIGRSHPDRNCLTSCLWGGEMAHVDCPAEPLRLRPGDLVLMASDGIETLAAEDIAGLLAALGAAPAASVAAALMQAVAAAADPDQDNLSLTVVRPLAAARTGLPVAALESGRPAARGRIGHILRRLAGVRA